MHKYWERRSLKFTGRIKNSSACIYLSTHITLLLGDSPLVVVAVSAKQFDVPFEPVTMLDML
jgi:hypothetical protein